jgi:hypothetical protein
MSTILRRSNGNPHRVGTHVSRFCRSSILKRQDQLCDCMKLSIIVVGSKFWLRKAIVAHELFIDFPLHLKPLPSASSTSINSFPRRSVGSSRMFQVPPCINIARLMKEVGWLRMFR